jgi:glycosyltransferase involved in cell wall biosynthesis
MSRADLHIALCTDGVFPQAMGGMQRHSRLLAEQLARMPGVRLTVVHPHAPPIFDPELGINEVAVAPIDEQRLYLRELWRYSGRVAHTLDELRPDVVLAQGFTVWQGMERFSSRLVVHPHGLEMFQGLTVRDRAIGAPFRWILRRIVRRSAICISLGGKLTPILERLTRGSGAQVRVIPNAVHVPEVMPPYPVDGGPLRLLFVGRFAFNKGLDVLRTVAERLVAEGKGDAVRFLLAGDGPMLAELRRDGLPPNVELLGKVDDAALEAAYHHGHALVLPTRFEGMPTVVLEAMAHARPVIVSDVGASAELVDTSNGHLLPPGDAAALYQAVIAMMDSGTAKRMVMGRASWERAKARFTWPAVAAATLELAQEVAARAAAQRE